MIQGLFQSMFQQQDLLGNNGDVLALAPGVYEARLMADDHDAVQAVAPFTVTE